MNASPAASSNPLAIPLQYSFNMNACEKLDNPVWYSLSESHQPFSIDYGNVKFYHPDYCPFGGFTQMQDMATCVDEYATRTDNFFIVGEKPVFSNALQLKNELVCLQMVRHKKIDMEMQEDIVKLNGEHIANLFKLVNLVQPGFFKNKTALLGNYYGIFKNGELVPAAGERMKMEACTEISAVVTHPHHTGKGYARQLIAHTVNNIVHQNQIAYLHVAESNTGAINLYEKLGFETRRRISFWHLIK